MPPVIRKPVVAARKAVTPSFAYKARTAEQVQSRANQSGTNREGFIKADFSTWGPKDGLNKIRILPPTWENADHYGLDIFVHYGIGPDNSAFVCPARMSNEPCPICEEREQTTDEDLQKEMRAVKRVAMWIIDRKEESKGPQIWCAPWTLDRDISSVSIDTDTGEVVSIDHPTEGYDVQFTRTKKGGDASMVEYGGVMISRRQSPIFDDEDALSETLEMVSQNPIPDTLLIQDYDHIANAFSGGPKKKEAKEEPVSRKPMLAKKAAVKKEPELPTAEEVFAMSEEELVAFAEEASVDFDGAEEFDSTEAMAAFVCEALGIEVPEAEEEPEEEPPPPPPKKVLRPAAATRPTVAVKTPVAASSTGSSWRDKLKKTGK